MESHKTEAAYPLLGQPLRSTVLRWTGIPTCVGIGPTKALAKLGNALAKADPDLRGVCDLSDPAAREAWLARTPVGEVWGTGRANAAKLARLGVRTAADFAALAPKRVRAVMTVVGERTVHELRGTPCLPLDLVPARRKGFAVTRMFAHRVEDWPTLEQAVATHATRLAEKLRREGLGANRLTVFFHTSPHDTGSPQRSAVTTVDLPEATSDALILSGAATRGARRVCRDGYRYSKAGVMTSDLADLAGAHRDLLDPYDRARSGRLMAALDACTARHGRGAVVPAKAGVPAARGWATKFEIRSPSYTTRLDDVPTVRA